MNKISPEDQLQYSQNCRQLIRQQQTLLISTVNEQAEPESSYAPYIRNEQGVFNIYVSELAAHTGNMLSNAKASLLFIQAEDQCQNLFARERVIIHCRVSEVDKQSFSYDQKLDLMQQKFGETVALLKGLNDFRLLELSPVKGRYIAGFGKAFVINTEDDTIILTNI